MNDSQIRLLSKMKKLILAGHRRFAIRKDRDYVQCLFELGISEEEAWNHILGLNKNFYFIDPKPSYLTSGQSLTFRKPINGKMAYIKLKIEYNDNDQEETVCLSFHINE